MLVQATCWWFRPVRSRYGVMVVDRSCPDLVTARRFSAGHGTVATRELLQCQTGWGPGVVWRRELRSGDWPATPTGGKGRWELVSFIQNLLFPLCRGFSDGDSMD